MTQFSSREPFNDDPYPTYPPGGHPMYNRPQTNPTNPILDMLRRNIQVTRVHRRFEIHRMLAWVDKAQRMAESGWVTREEEDHARRVLERLAIFNEGERSA